jgi:hypothetical protein
MNWLCLSCEELSTSCDASHEQQKNQSRPDDDALGATLPPNEKAEPPEQMARLMRKHQT